MSEPQREILTAAAAPMDWQPVPKDLREWYWTEATPACRSLRDVRFVQWVRDAIDRGEIEVKFVVKNSRYPDPRNRYYWRRRQGTLFDGGLAA